MTTRLRALAWIMSGLLAVILLTHPVSVGAQLTLSLCIIAAMALVWRMGASPYNRQLFLALGSFVVIRYLYWRITSTLPPSSDPVGLTFGIFVLLAEFYCVLILVISLTISADPLRRPALEQDPDEQLPTVDVYIPTYNEDEYILATTIAAAKSMDYPADKLTVWLLDDGGTDQKCNDSNPQKAEAARKRRVELMALCKQLGAVYLTRKRNEHAKAGNMNNALAVSTGEIVVVFDADHAPFRAFLRETIGHFARDPKLFLVQTPHIFLNPDPIEKNLRTFHRMPSENEMFYSSIQRGLDKWNGSFFCGSAALLRRSALETVGGFSGITITEDCETALDLHSQGWTSVFVDKPLIAGLQPETFASFIGQRSRWCQGMMQILILKNPLFKKGLKPIQKIAYLSSMTFWLFPLPRLVFLLAPLLFILADIKVFVSNLDEAIAYTATYMVVNLMMQNYLYGSLRWPWISELYEYCQGVFLSKALVSVALSPRKPTFNVTAKGLSLENDHLSELAWPFFAIYGLLLLGLGVSVWRYFNEPAVAELMVVVGLWNLFNLLIAGTALGAVAERKQVDRHPRLGIARQGFLHVNGGAVPVEVVDVSAGGCGLTPVGKAPFELRAGETEGLLTIEPVSGIVARNEALPVKLRHTNAIGDKVVYGFEFHGLMARDYYVLADLMYGDSQALPRFLASRRTHKNVFAGTFEFVVWGVTEPVRAVAYSIRELRTARAAPEAAAPEPSTKWLHVLLAQARGGKKSDNGASKAA
ncbi:MAG: UDP-forming cellulose synthase catalytic subunit [Beijerinckiaceae bacterium]|nr:UDP-forming cellulose synthase catalytic subunit [Beijerinckiaceae bacterium]